MKTAYEHSTNQPDGASWMPGNVIREEHGSSGMGSAMPNSAADSSNASGGNHFMDGPFKEQRAVAYRSGIDAARHHFGVKRSSLTQPGTPETNALLDTVKKPNPDKFPDAGTGYATSGAQYGADSRK